MKLSILQEILLLALLESKIYSREHDKFKSCRVYLSDCGEVPLSTVPLAYLQHHYGNCKFVLGNLVICDLKRLDNGSDPDLSFLDTIEEVSGYVYLSRNEVRRIPLKSLKVIRGEPAYQFGDEYGSLIVTRNGRNLTYGLETIDLRSIVAIQRHNAIVMNNPLLCNFAFTIDWHDVFPDPSSQRYVPDRTTSTISQGGCNILRNGIKTRTYESCDKSCNMFEGKGYCWGPGPELCQKLSKCRNDPMRYCVDGPLTDQLCDEECLGGCEQAPNKCRSCKHVENDGKCVTQCPPQFIVSRVDSRTIPNPDFKYNFHDTCVDNCPAPFLKSKSYCVIECDLSSEIPINGTCQACPPTGCPEHCTQKSIFNSVSLPILNSEALKKFKSCVYYTGMLYISEESFMGSRMVKTPIRDLNLLWNLRNLQAIVGLVYMDFRGAPSDLRNLTFLENLRSIIREVRGASSGPVLQIMNGFNVEMLGFRSLTHLDGAVYLVNMTKLCYLDAIKKMAQYRAVNVSTEEQCVQRHAVCHSECLPQLGCWGPGSDMCRHCCNLLAGDHCVSECTDIPGFYEVPDLAAGKLRLSTPSGSTPQPFCRTLPLNQSQIDILNDAVVRETKLPPKRCGVCHEECAETCYGPGANECKGACKHFQDGDYCVRECPREKYAEQGTNRCLPCNATCTQAFVAPETRLCSGPGDYLGLGGCTACWTVLQSKETNRFHCLINDCPASHYTESHKTLDFVEANRISISQEAKQVALATTEAGGMIRVCKPCHPFCDVCTANGTHMSICHSCLHWWFRVECVKECPPAETYTIKANETEDIANETAMGQPSIEELNQRDRRSSEEKTKSDPIRNTHAESLLLLPGAIDQKHCLLCHEECIQGCSGPGPEHCVRCRNYKVIIDGEKNTFVCNSSCPDDKPHMFHGMCLDSQQFSKLSGRSAKELRDRILIGVAVAVILLILLVTTILAVCLKRRAESERTREKLFSAYTNLHEAERESVMKSQSGVREPNMSRLEMISADDLDYDRASTPLGSGAFGVVYRGIWRLPKATLLKHGCHRPQKLDVAIKIIQNEYPITPTCLTSPSVPQDGLLRDEKEETRRATARANLEELLEEAKVMASVDHVNCLPLIGICVTKDRHCMVTVFLELGSLDRYVKQHCQSLSSLTLLSWAEQIADGMSYLETRGIIHRDLAARNVLVQRPDLVKITDFGLAKMLERRDENSVVVRAGRVPIRWLAIETLQDSIYSHKTDVWSYGVTLWEIFTYGRRPYDDVETKDIKDHVMKGGRLTQPDICTLDVYMVLVKCWMEDYESRPTFEELKRIFHNFCKTPGRYLYIQGDEYAINYQGKSPLGSTPVSDEAHELRQFTRWRSAPDGSDGVNANGSICRTTATDFDDNHLDEERRHPFGASTEPTESDALLPVRTVGHSMWPLRNKLHPVSPFEESTGNGHARLKRPVYPGASSAHSVAARSSERTPQLPHNNVWLSGAPGSPSWKTPRLDVRSGPNDMNTSLASPFPSEMSTRQGTSAVGDAPRFGPPSPTLTPTRLNSQIRKPNPTDESEYLANPLGLRPSGLEGYLEPKPSPVSSNTSFNRTGNLGQNFTPFTETDYLVPKSSKMNAPQSSIHDFGITNMEYFMQPYITPEPVSRQPSNTSPGTSHN